MRLTHEQLDALQRNLRKIIDNWYQVREKKVFPSDAIVWQPINKPYVRIQIDPEELDVLLLMARCGMGEER